MTDTRRVDPGGSEYPKRIILGLNVMVSVKVSGPSNMGYSSNIREYSWLAPPRSIAIGPGY